MENLTKSRIIIHIGIFLLIVFIGFISRNIYSRIGFGPCVYKYKYTKSDIILYEDSFLFWDWNGVDKICNFKKENTEYCNFEINTVHGDYLKFDVVVSYDINASELTKNDLHLFLNGFGFLKNKDVLSYGFKTNIPKIQGRSIRDIEKDIENVVINSYGGIPSFVKDFDVNIKVSYLK